MHWATKEIHSQIYLKNVINCSHRPHSWFGRMALFKMDSLSHILYVFQAIPLHLPKIFFHRSHSTLRFIWTTYPLQIKYEVLVLPKASVGVGLPYLERYYQATHLTRLLDHFHNVSHKLWTTLEAVTSALALTSLPWIDLDKLSPPQSLPFRIIPFLRAWDSLITKNDISSYSGALTLCIKYCGIGIELVMVHNFHSELH